jgi:putative intracellular protease/amidase
MYFPTLISSALCAALTLSTTSSALILPTNSTQKPLRIGILYEHTQMSDLIGLDFLSAQTPEVTAIKAQNNPIFEQLMPYATPMEFLYISSSLDAAWTTPKMFVKPTHTYATAPRDLDILVIGGPDPAAVADESLVFLREASKETKVIMTVCTGGMWLAKSGVLDGKKATTNRGTLANAAKLWPEVKWADQRWVVEDGHFEGAQIWTAGGAGCGESCVVVGEMGVVLICAHRCGYVHRVYGSHVQQKVGQAGLCWIGL